MLLSKGQRLRKQLGHSTGSICECLHYFRHFVCSKLPLVVSRFKRSSSCHTVGEGCSRWREAPKLEGCVGGRWWRPAAVVGGFLLLRGGGGLLQQRGGGPGLQSLRARSLSGGVGGLLQSLHWGGGGLLHGRCRGVVEAWCRPAIKGPVSRVATAVDSAIKLHTARCSDNRGCFQVS
jgi:hypothetical protein